jgi:hypothetical protein
MTRKTKVSPLIAVNPLWHAMRGYKAHRMERGIAKDCHASLKPQSVTGPAIRLPERQGVPGAHLSLDMSCDLIEVPSLTMVFVFPASHIIFCKAFKKIGPALFNARQRIAWPSQKELMVKVRKISEVIEGLHLSVHNFGVIKAIKNDLDHTNLGLSTK